MATSLLGRALAPFRPTSTRSASQESVISAATVDSSSHTRLSDSSTPPTSAADSESISSGAVKRENTDNVNAKAEEDSDLEADGATPRDYGSAGRSRRPRSSYPGSYNLKVLSGTAMHAPKKFRNGDSNGAKMLTRRRTISGDTLVDPISDTSSFIGSVKKEPKAHARIGMDALDLHNSDKKTAMLRSRAGLGLGEGAHRRKAPQKDDETSFRRATRSAGEPVESLTAKLTVLGKRGRNKFEAGLVKAKRELRRLADTKEFAKIDTKPVVEEVWSNGKLWTGEEAPKKRVKVESATGVKSEEELKTIEEVKLKQNRQKLWLNKGLYSGQEVRNLDWFAALSKDEKKKMVNIPAFKPNGVLPLPMWHGQRLLHTGRHFKLPFDVCSPLPPGQPKPDEWRKVPKNRFIGDAAAAWKKTTVFDDFSSRCVCSPLNGCDESCQNRIMLYECDDGNCSAGREHCTNRAFSDLQERRSKGGKYRIGVEVIKTADRGYGVRSNRCFEAHQIIVEYTGEIITEEECDRRMNEDYKDNECYYLMSFDQNMIIDATRGSIARFVNHSCEPNCRMVKWIVAGKPRMALFAGDNPIMSGEELTYDYNFDPFSAKNVQECRCGAETCRGVLGPRPKDKPKPVMSIGKSLKRAVNAGKRKLGELLLGEKETGGSPKRRKIIAATKTKNSTKVIPAVKELSRGLSNALKSATKGRRSTTLVRRESTKARILTTYGSANRRVTKQTFFSSSRTSSLTLVNDIPSIGKKSGKGKAIQKDSDSEGIASNLVSSPRKRTLSTKGEELQRIQGKNSPKGRKR